MKNKIYSILIANRGEIANRVIRTCKKLGIRSVLVYSNIDKSSLPVELADESYNIGGETAAESYLNMDKILQVALEAKVDAIHPGYGFLSENALFAKKCKENGIIFIGPSPESIESMGSKSNAKLLMQQHGVPVVPGYLGEDQSTDRLKKEAERISYPLLIKAAAGGGGKGMQIVRSSKDLEKAIETAKREGKSYFGSDELILERYFDKVRHIEVQIFGDSHRNVVHFFERECTIQRRYQKIIEEAPSPAVDDELRLKITDAAVKAAKAINYENAGTVEFILDERGDFYFLEVNTRLQVEHPVTEEISGVDLVELQIAVAEGSPIPYKQENIKINGYAIECRLYAEDPNQDFIPLSGKVLRWDVNQEIARIETAITDNAEVSIFYDPMIAKFIIHGKNRYDAQRKMIGLLGTLYAPGINTNREFLLNILGNDLFKKGDYSTHFIEQNLADLLPEKSYEELSSFLIVATIFAWKKRTKSIPDNLIGWRNLQFQPQKISYEYSGKNTDVFYTYNEKGKFTFSIDGVESNVFLKNINKDTLLLEINNKTESFRVLLNEEIFYVQNSRGSSLEFQLLDRFPISSNEKQDEGYLSPMPAQVLKTCFEPNSNVKSGETLIVLSSMKMEISIDAKTDGILEDYQVSVGENIAKNTPLLIFKPVE